MCLGGMDGGKNQEEIGGVGIKNLLYFFHSAAAWGRDCGQQLGAAGRLVYDSGLVDHCGLKGCADY